MPTAQSFANIIDKAHLDKPLKDILELSPCALRGVSDKDAALLKEAFGIQTIGDLGTNKFFQWAQALTALAHYEKG